MAGSDDEGLKEDCDFCQIISGKRQAHNLYKNKYAQAFLNPNPVADGHTFVVPRRHVERFSDLEKKEAAELFKAVHEVADAVQTEMDTEGLNILQSNGPAAGQEVDHVYVHVIPRTEGDGFDFKFQQRDLTEDEAQKLERELDDALPG